MPKHWRHIIFFLFVLAFFISAPLIVLYTAGYRYHFGTNQIVQTGVLSVASVPRSSNVIIDGQTTSEKTPVVFDDIFPGEHVVQIEKAGYTAWQKTVRVESRKTSFATDAVLFLNQVPIKQNDQSIIKGSVNPNQTSLAYLVKTKTFLELRVMENPDQEARLLLRVSYDPHAKYVLDWSKNGNHLLFDVQRGPLHELTLISLITGSVTEVNISERISSYWWDVGADEMLYVRGRFSLFTLNANAGEQTRLAHNYMARTYNGNELVVTPSKNQTTVSLSQPDGSSKILAYIPFGEYAFETVREELVLLSEKQSKKIVLLNPKDQQPILFQADANLWKWNNEQELLVYTDGFEIQVFDTKSNKNYTVTRSSSRFDFVTWHPDHNILFVEQDNTLFTTEYFGSEKNQTHLTDGFDLEHIWFSKNNDDLFFVTVENDQQAIYTRHLQK